MKKKNVKVTIIAEAVLFAIVFFSYVILCGEKGEIIAAKFIDFPSLIGILFISILGLMFMGEWKSFIRAFSIGEKQFSLMELKNMVEAIGTCQKLVLYGGLVELLISFIVFCSNVSETTVILANLSVMAVSGFYVIFFEYLLLPLKSNAVRCMNEEMDVDCEE